MFFYRVTGLDIEKYKKAGLNLTRPRILGLYEYREGRLSQAKRMKYLKKHKNMDYPLDLNKDYENLMFAQPQHRLEVIYTPLNDAMSLPEPFSLLTRVYAPRRVLTLIMETCISRKNFNLDISHYNGSLFIEGLQHTAPNHKIRHIKSLEYNLFSASPEEFPAKNNSDDANFSLSALHTSILGKFALIYTGGIQGIIADEEFHNFSDLEAVNQLRYVLCKQMGHIRNKRLKYLRYWLQGYLANVDDIYVGFKNSDGIVESPLEHITVSNIPKNYTSWKPEICVGVLHEFLEKVQQLMANVNSVDTVYNFNFNGKTQTFSYRKYEGRTWKSFVSKYFTNLDLV